MKLFSLFTYLKLVGFPTQSLSKVSWSLYLGTEPEKHPEKNGIPASGPRPCTKQRKAPNEQWWTAVMAVNCQLDSRAGGREKERERESDGKDGTHWGNRRERWSWLVDDFTRMKRGRICFRKTHNPFTVQEKIFLLYCPHNGTFFWSDTFYVCKF